MTGAEPKPQPEQQPEPRKRRRAVHVARRAGVWTFRSSLLAVILVGLSAFMIVGTRLHTPDWLRARVEARIERNLNGLQISFGDIEMVIRKGWHPRLRLRDVVLSQPDGQVVAQLSNAEASLAMRPLLRGQLQPHRISLSGVLATLRRDKDGAVSLALGLNAEPAKRAESIPELIAGWNRQLLNPQLTALVSVDVEAVALRYEDMVSGKAWTLDGGRIRLDRSGRDLQIGASFALLSGRDYASLIEANYSATIGEKQAGFGVSVRDIDASDIAAQSVALAWLDVLRAPISGALRGSVGSDGAFGPLSATLQIGEGALQPTDATHPIPFSGAKSYFTYTPATKTLVFNELSVDSAWGSSSGEGRAYLGSIADGRLQDLVGQFTVNRMRLNPAGLYPEPLQLDSGLVEFRLELNPFRVTLGQMYVADGDSGFHLRGGLEAGSEGWRLAVDANVDRLSPERLLMLWPGRVAPKPREWVQENISAGALSNIDFALRVNEGQAPVIYGDFEFAGAKVRYNKYLPPAEQAAGEVTLDRSRFVVSADAGIVTPAEGGAVDIAGTSFIIPDIGIKQAAPAVLRLRADGSITAMMSMLAGPPLRVLKDTTLPVNLAQGRARAEGTLSFPMQPKVPYEDISFYVDGRLSDISSTVLIPGQLLTASALRLVADTTQVQLSGTGRVGQLPIVVRWTQKIGPGAPKSSRVDGQVELSQKAVDTFALGLPAGMISGQGTGQFALDLVSDQPPRLTLRTDLRGVGLSIPQLGWRKPEAGTGALEVSAHLGERAEVDRLALKAAGLEATGSVTTAPGGGLGRARFSSVKLNGWLDAGVELIGRGKDAAPAVQVLSGTLDLGRARFGSGASGATDGGSLQVSLDRLQISDGLALTGFNGQFTTAGGLKGPFTGRLNGQTEIAGRIEPQNGRSAVFLTSDDGGGVFRSAGILKQAHGGAFSLVLRPVGDKEGYFDGTLKVTGTQIRDAPTIAALLNAVSVVGLFDEVAGNGIQFSEVAAKVRLEPDRVVVLESSAVGPSMGLSMDGYYNLKSATLDMEGVISPIYLLNAIGSVLSSRKGEGMIGFNYTLSGSAASPSVHVNPLSGLAPGMLRDLFRGERPKLEGDDNFDPAPATPEPARKWHGQDMLNGAMGGK
ncbi:AsmA family protein [Pseudodonghicola xiamenensis]|uniref:AsmA domain-containing protein n=1 Tax=Pseudodonghicola xiamenensis TaxID=337702 RepID=A0A8J3H4Z3_9RHOB|nr:AsmA-like C-terminal region-containing protein [Pseudodonghicola xiamenensis]GHG87440.1 hypothetical protein GCM10010961_15880 [Pseudodonghicola xiamenensis]